MLSEPWTTVESFSDRPSAEALVELLTFNDLPCYLAAGEIVPGAGGSFAVRVRPDSLEKARAVLEQLHVSDEELTRQALDGSTGEGDDH